MAPEILEMNHGRGIQMTVEAGQIKATGMTQHKGEDISSCVGLWRFGDGDPRKPIRVSVPMTPDEMWEFGLALVTLAAKLKEDES